MAKRDSGYALIAALAAMLVFSLVAFELLAASKGNVALAGGEFERARLAAAAEAGVTTALAGAATDDATLRWAIDGRSRSLTFDGIALTIRVEDERGKIPITVVTEDQFRLLLQTAGVTGDQLDTLVDSYEDWIDDDDDRRAHGAEKPDYAAHGIAPRNGAIRSLDELLSIRGFDQALYDRIAPSLTVFFGESGGFSSSTAQPLALAVMEGGGMRSPSVIERQRELAGERPAIELGDDTPLTGRILTVRVTADDGSQGHLARAAIVELTGDAKNPYWIRWQD